MFIRPAQPEDAAAWERLRTALWPPPEGGDLASEIARYFAGRLSALAQVLLAFDDDGTPIGFVELSFRSHAEGCVSQRIPYVEGWYVEPHRRKSGVGAALIRAAEDWARSLGATELASDTQVANTGSIDAHRALGFTEVERTVCFMKSL